MASTKESIKLYGYPVGPNPLKVAILLEELNLPWELVYVEDVKSETFTKLNPNGRVPAIHDPNTGLTLWESGAIVEYLIETYDKGHRLSYASFTEKYQLKQYLHFQMSGQGPYYGQLVWFSFSHPEKIESAIKRYEEQVWRVISVLDKILEGREYLVGDKVTYADLAFVPWERLPMKFLKSPEQIQKFGEYPNYVAWVERLSARPSIGKAEKAIQDASPPRESRIQ